jgi:hypothetical protein
MKVRIYLRDPKSGKDSVTLTAFIIGFVVCLAKLALAGMTIRGIDFAPFSGVDFAAAVGALGAIYGYRKMSEDKTATTQVASGKPPVEGGGE